MLIKLLNSTWTPKNVIPWENLIPTKIPSFPSFFIKTGIYRWPNNFPQYIQCPKIPFMELPLVKFQIYPISPSVHHHSPNDSRFISSQWSLSLWGSWALRHGFIWYNMWLFLGPRGPLRTPLMSVVRRCPQRFLTQPLIILFQTLS